MVIAAPNVLPSEILHFAQRVCWITVIVRLSQSWS